MIYVDTSVLLAHVLAEDRAPPDAFWSERLVSSRLLMYEAWNRVHALGLQERAGEALRAALAEVDMVEMNAVTLGRALEPFPIALRTLDALHLATADFLRHQGRQVRLATYDDRLAEGARALGIPVFDGVLPGHPA